MRHASEASVVAEFYALAKEFCDWAESASADHEAVKALRLLAALYEVGLILPETTPGDLARDAEEVSPLHGKGIYERFQRLPIGLYHEIYAPLDDPPEQITGDLADDLRDIYLDLRRGVRRYEAGHRDDAVFEWRFSFGIHWGRHATSAMRALHQHVTSVDGD